MAMVIMVDMLDMDMAVILEHMDMAVILEHMDMEDMVVMDTVFIILMGTIIHTPMVADYTQDMRRI